MSSLAIPPASPTTASARGEMLSLARLRELQSEAFADDVEFDADTMATWREHEVLEYFTSGGAQSLTKAKNAKPPTTPKAEPVTAVAKAGSRNGTPAGATKRNTTPAKAEPEGTPAKTVSRKTPAKEPDEAAAKAELEGMGAKAGSRNGTPAGATKRNTTPAKAEPEGTPAKTVSRKMPAKESDEEAAKAEPEGMGAKAGSRNGTPRQVTKQPQGTEPQQAKTIDEGASKSAPRKNVQASKTAAESATELGGLPIDYML